MLELVTEDMLDEDLFQSTVENYKEMESSIEWLSLEKYQGICSGNVGV